MTPGKVILSGLFDRYPRLKIVVATMGGGLLPCMGRLDCRLAARLRRHAEDSAIRCKKLPSEYLRLSTSTTWVSGAPQCARRSRFRRRPRDVRHRLRAGAARSKGMSTSSALGIAPADKEKIFWRNAAAFFNLEVAG